MAEPNDDTPVRPSMPSREPVELVLGTVSCLLMVDYAVSIGTGAILVGWTSLPEAEIWIVGPDGPVPVTFQRTVRHDVIVALGLKGRTHCGFTLVASRVPKGDLTLMCRIAGETAELPLALGDHLGEDGRRRAAKGVLMHLAERPVASGEWQNFRQILPQNEPPGPILSGYVDVAYSSRSYAAGFVSGWETSEPSALVWLEDDKGGLHDLARGFRWHRPDLAAASPEVPDRGVGAGFVAQIWPDPGATTIRLCAAVPNGIQSLPPVPLKHLPETGLGTVGALIEADVPQHLVAERARLVDLPLLADVRGHEQKLWQGAALRSRSVGTVPKTPRITVIVPIYGRYDLAEHQLLEFDRDPDFTEAVEVIYVLDDPALEEPFVMNAPRMQQTSGPGFRWVASNFNRGFSGANNLGAAEAGGDVLIFCNSDVFPIRPGWATALAARLDADPGLGLVAPRLLFGNGTIQHAGMTSRWRADFGMYMNNHPHMGMERDYDPATGLTEMPMVTGACIAMRREVFERLGGWDEGFVAGDFEDSDLCLRAREAGFRIGYDPDVELTHLERQSFRDPSDTHDRRRRITLLNAVRYNQKWHGALAALDA